CARRPATRCASPPRSRVSPMPCAAARIPMTGAGTASSRPRVPPAATATTPAMRSSSNWSSKPGCWLITVTTRATTGAPVHPSAIDGAGDRGRHLLGRSAEQVTLAVVAAQLTQQRLLLVGLDAFADGVDTEGTGQCLDRPHHRDAFVLAVPG